MTLNPPPPRMCFKSHLNCPLAAGKLAIFQADSYWQHMHIVGKKKAYRTIIQFKGEGHAMGGGGAIHWPALDLTQQSTES